MRDALGNIRTIIDGSGNITESRLYSPYGEPYGGTGSAQTVYGFTGEPKDDATGFVHLRARYYNPSLGQFMNLDPKETANRFAYVMGNPVNATDPSGLQAGGCREVTVSEGSEEVGNVEMRLSSRWDAVVTSFEYRTTVDFSYKMDAKVAVSVRPPLQLDSISGDFHVNSPGGINVWHRVHASGNPAVWNIGDRRIGPLVTTANVVEGVAMVRSSDPHLIVSGCSFDVRGHISPTLQRPFELTAEPITEDERLQGQYWPEKLEKRKRQIADSLKYRGPMSGGGPAETFTGKVTCGIKRTKTVCDPQPQAQAQAQAQAQTPAQAARQARVEKALEEMKNNPVNKVGNFVLDAWMTSLKLDLQAAETQARMAALIEAQRVQELALGEGLTSAGDGVMAVYMPAFALYNVTTPVSYNFPPVSEPGAMIDAYAVYNWPRAYTAPAPAPLTLPALPEYVPLEEPGRP